MDRMTVSEARALLRAQKRGRELPRELIGEAVETIQEAVWELKTRAERLDNLLDKQ